MSLTPSHTPTPPTPHTLTGQVLLEAVLDSIVRKLCNSAVKLIISRTGCFQSLKLYSKI